MNRLTRSLSAELRKITATKMWWIMTIVIVAYTAMMSGVFSAIFGELSEMMAGAGQGVEATVDPADSGVLVLSTVSTFGYVVPLLFGAVMATGELRHGTLGLAFVTEPRRGVVLASKLLVLLLGGAVLGLAGLIGALTPAVPLLPEGWVTAELVPVALRVMLVIALWAVIGFGVGLLIRHQAVTVVIVLVFTQFVEPMLRTAGGIWDWSATLTKFLPGSASDGTVGASILADMTMFDPDASSNSTVFGVGVSLCILLGYAVVAVLAAWATRWRRDIQ